MPLAASRADAPDEVTNELSATQSPLNSRRFSSLVSLLFTMRSLPLRRSCSAVKMVQPVVLLGDCVVQKTSTVSRSRLKKMEDTYRWHQSPGSPPMTYAHSASISSGSSTSSHGGILRFPLVTESTKRAWALHGKSRRLIAHCGLRIRVPWQVAQWCANSAEPFLICSGVNCGSPSCAAALAHTNARPKLAVEKTFMCLCDRP